MAGLSGQMLPQVEAPRSLPFRGRAAALHDLRTYFIAVATDANTAMHYNVSDGAASLRLQTLDPARQDLPGSATPPGVEQRHSLVSNNEIDGNAIGHRDGEQDAWCDRDPAIDSIDLDPATTGIETHDVGAMDLTAEHGGVEFRHFPAEG